MEILCIEDNGKVYRVRKEEEGCSIFGPGYFIEGNDILFDVLKHFNTEEVSEAYSNLLNEYSVESERLKKDLIMIAKEFIESNIFNELANKILLLSDCEL